MVFARIGRRRCGFLANWFGDSFESEGVMPCPRDEQGRVSDAAAKETRDRGARSVPPPAGSDHRPVPCAGKAFAHDRLAVFGDAVWVSVFGWPWLPAVADAADGRLGP